LKELVKYQEGEIDKAIHRAHSSGNEDLELEDAALKAANVIGKDGSACIR
jgi:hypothetical protein